MPGRIAPHLAVAVGLLLVPWTEARAQLETPEGWRWVMDAAATLVQEQAVPDGGWRFVAMPPGWHVTMGPGGVLYHPAHAAAGRYALEAETFLFPEPSDEGFGLFVGGRGLDGPTPEYVTFLIRADGHSAVARHAGGVVTLLAPWSPGDSVVAQRPSGTARNVLRVSVDPDSVVFSVNGGRVAGLARAGVAPDGQFGFRVGAGINLHISTLDLTQGLAPPRR